MAYTGTGIFIKRKISLDADVWAIGRAPGVKTCCNSPQRSYVGVVA